MNTPVSNGSRAGFYCVLFLALLLLIPLRLAVGRPEYTPRGTPFVWLDLYGLRTDADDDDADGRFTWEEYITGGNPTNADDFSIHELSVHNRSNLTVRWFSSTGGAPDPYVVRFATNPLPGGTGSWHVVGVSPRTPPVNTWTGLYSTTPGFFRVDATYAYSPGVSLTVSGSPASEPTGTATVTAVVSSPYYLPITVHLGLSGTAGPGDDYDIESTSIVIPPGHYTESVRLVVRDDDLAEDQETAVVDIVDVENGHETGTQQVTVLINSEDPKAPRIRVVKDSVPDDPQDFWFVGDLGDFDLDDDPGSATPNARWFGPLDPGSYEVVEELLQGWDLDSIDIKDPDGGSMADPRSGKASIDLDEGETVVVRYRNIKRGGIEVVKNAVPDDAQDFLFTSSMGPFSLDDDRDPKLSNSIRFGDLPPGTYMVTEATAAGWTLGLIAIEDPDGGSVVNMETRTATLDLDPGEAIRVIFHNLQYNDPPLADGGGPYAVSEGASVTLDGSASSDPDEPYGDAITRYEWDLDNNGTFETPSVPLSNAFVTVGWPALSALGLDDGPSTHSIRLRVTDRHGASGTNSATLHLVNAPPEAANLALTGSVAEGGTAVLSGSIVDPGDDTFSLRLDWGDGTTQHVALGVAAPGVTWDPVTRTFSVEHAHVDDGTHPGNLTARDLAILDGVVADDDGGESPLVGPTRGPSIDVDENASGWQVTQQIQAGEPIGQTFTAISGSRLDTISVWVADMNAEIAPADYSIEIELYEGAGTTGRLLGRREFAGLSDDFSGFITVDFSSVTLVEGQVYTIALDNDTARWGRVAVGDQYGGGTAWYAGVASPTADALFRVQWQADFEPPALSNDDNDTGWSVTQQIQAGEPIGQTFTAISGNRLDTISMWVADMNAGMAPTDYSIEFELYEGVGTSGRLLGRREYTGLTDGFSGFATVDFSSVTLAAGQLYTVVVVNDTARWGRLACGNQYAGGTALYANAPSPTAEALFRVEWQPDGAVPVAGNDDNDTGWSVTQQIQAGDPIGQTFTAISGNRLNTISMWVADMNAGVAPTDYSIEFELYEGVGTSGRLLGRREYTGLTDGFSGFATVDFSSVTLAAGQMFTVVLKNDTARWGRLACGNQYAGGTALYANAPSPTSDALFRVEWQPDGAVPVIANDDNDTGWSVTQQIQAGAPIGQTFTAISGNRLNTISMYVADMNAGVAPTDYSIDFELYEGVGTTGRLLGRREYTGLSDGFSGFVTVDFSSVTLAEGQMYTAVLENDTARWGRVACGNQYAGGTAVYADAPSPTSDALFRVEWQPDDEAPVIANDDNDTGWSVTQQIQAGEPIGQTFTAISGNRLNTISMWVADMNAGVAPTDYSLTVRLYEGVGTGGTLLGTREFTGLSDGFSGFVTVDFSTITLAEGQMYTVVLDNDTARWGRMAVGDQYAGGTAIYAGVPSPTSDALFVVRWFPDTGRLFTVVENQPPVVDAGPDAVLPVGVLTRTVTFTDPGVEDVHQVQVDYGDGSLVETATLATGERQFAFKHTYRQQGKYTVTVTVRDDDLGEHTDSFSVVY